ncbi:MULTISPECIES: hypothetical protein [unclassified Coleofasciculus]|uniref:hypothetical protein n=1 Tax=unclassified Coleofasciculus TaxID=2692782 RepID=UPI0018807B9F|nr:MULTISPECIES: hypothetical protein [unclassified Coleofasciculus]MBE9124717.1 hypothetical protein [Coleofasciculus sp. LEGE 07081]MBE9151842.1 hypothetical protein [Coleofasciculus sp. LEGE 07092]
MVFVNLIHSLDREIEKLQQQRVTLKQKGEEATQILSELADLIDSVSGQPDAFSSLKSEVMALFDATETPEVFNSSNSFETAPLTDTAETTDENAETEKAFDSNNSFALSVETEISEAEATEAEMSESEAIEAEATETPEIEVTEAEATEAEDIEAEISESEATESETTIEKTSNSAIYVSDDELIIAGKSKNRLNHWRNWVIDKIPTCELGEVERSTTDYKWQFKVKGVDKSNQVFLVKNYTQYKKPK